MFMPSLNNYYTRSHMALDIPLCRTIKGQKSHCHCHCHFLDIKTATTTSSFTHHLKKEILSKLVNCKSEQFYWFLLLLLLLLLFCYYCYYYYSYYFFSLIFWKLFFFTIFPCIHTSRGTLMEMTTVLAPF